MIELQVIRQQMDALESLALFRVWDGKRCVLQMLVKDFALTIF